MNSLATDFLNRIFNNNRTNWWKDLCSETPKRNCDSNARFLQETLTKELSDVPEYRSGDRRLFFFSTRKTSSIDGRYGSLGVEEKYNPLDLKEHLIDGAIHRGLIWVLGNPQKIKPPVEAVSLYVVRRDSTPISSDEADLYFPVITAIYKLGVHVIFINEDTGEYWCIASELPSLALPDWLSVKKKPAKWDMKLEKLTNANRKALAVLNNELELRKLQKNQSFLPGLGKTKGQFTEIKIDDSCKVAIMDYGNQWRLLECGLLLRSYGYHAVKVIYNSEKHKNTKDRGKPLRFADRNVEKRVAEKMLEHFAVKIDWGVVLSK